MEPSRKVIQDMYMRAQQRISQFHVRTFEGQPGPILLISTAYPASGWSTRLMRFAMRGWRATAHWHAAWRWGS